MSEEKTLKCDKCDREFTEKEALDHPGHVHVHQGVIMCEDCLISTGVTPDSSTAYATYIRNATEPGFFNRFMP